MTDAPLQLSMAAALRKCSALCLWLRSQHALGQHYVHCWVCNNMFLAARVLRAFAKSIAGRLQGWLGTVVEAAAASAAGYSSNACNFEQLSFSNCTTASLNLSWRRGKPRLHLFTQPKCISLVWFHNLQSCTTSHARMLPGPFRALLGNSVVRN